VREVPERASGCVPEISLDGVVAVNNQDMGMRVRRGGRKRKPAGGEGGPKWGQGEVHMDGL